MLVIGTSRGLMTAGPDETPNKTPNAGAGSFVTLLGSIVSSTDTDDRDASAV